MWSHYLSMLCSFLRSKTPWNHGTPWHHWWWSKLDIATIQMSLSPHMISKVIWSFRLQKIHENGLNFTNFCQNRIQHYCNNIIMISYVMQTWNLKLLFLNDLLFKCVHLHAVPHSTRNSEMFLVTHIKCLFTLLTIFS